MKDYYEILEVTSDASEEVIKAAYKALVKRMHPDNGGTAVPGEKNIEDINEAYEVLSDKNKKAAYDYEWEKYKNSATEQQNARTQTREEAQPSRNERKEKIAGGIAAAVLSIVFRILGLPRWLGIIAICYMIFCLAGLVSPYIIEVINQLPAAKGHWNSDDSESLEGLVTLIGLKITFAVYGIHNWLSGICTFLMVFSLIWVVFKVVEIIVKVDEP